MRYSCLIYNEKQRRMARRLKRFLGKENAGALSAVSVIEDRVQKELTAKRDIEDACYIKNK